MRKPKSKPAPAPEVVPVLRAGSASKRPPPSDKAHILLKDGRLIPPAHLAPALVPAKPARSRKAPK